MLRTMYTNKSFPKITLNSLCSDVPLDSSGGNPWLELNTDVERMTCVLLEECSATCVVNKHLIEKDRDSLY